MPNPSIAQHREAVRARLNEILEGTAKWRTNIPVCSDYDSDILLCASLADISELLKHVDAQDRRIAALEDAMNPQDVADVDAALRASEADHG